MTSQPGHRQVSDDQVNLIVPFDQFERCFTIFSLEYRVPVLL
jgi:hypothetical protein